MKACGHCKQKAEWRYKDGWGVFACAEWFTGKCEGLPLDVAPPSVGDLRPKGRGFDEDEKYSAQRIGIIDMQAAGLPQSQGQFVDRKDLETGSLLEYTLLQLNPRRDYSNSYYYTDFLETAHTGSMPAKEVRRYFRFIELIYVPLGNAELEKYIFDGLAILLGVYPSIYVASLSSVFEDVQLQRYFFLFALLMMRSLPIFLLLFVLSKIMLSRRSGQWVFPALLERCG